MATEKGMVGLMSVSKWTELERFFLTLHPDITFATHDRPTMTVVNVLKIVILVSLTLLCVCN